MKSEHSVRIASKTRERAAESTMIPKIPACPYCQSSSRRFFQLTHTTVYRCKKRTCGLQFASPQPDERALSEAYDQLYYPLVCNREPVWEPHPSSPSSSLLKVLSRKSVTPAGKRILDYGGGKGSLLRALTNLGAMQLGSNKVRPLVILFAAKDSLPRIPPWTTSTKKTLNLNSISSL